MLEKIPWDQLTPHNSPVLFKRLKDEILKLRDEGLVLVTFKELEGVLRSRLPTDVKFADAQLETVVTLLDGPGVVKELGFGSYILLRPEWINAYAQAVIRTLRAAESGLGCLPVSSIMEGKLIFQTTQPDGKKRTRSASARPTKRWCCRPWSRCCSNADCACGREATSSSPAIADWSARSGRCHRSFSSVTRFAVFSTTSTPRLS